jgi:SAM-dependent methyltransferase
MCAVTARVSLDPIPVGEEMVMGSADGQARLWGTAPRDWADVVEPLVRPLHDAIVRALTPLTGRSLLDVGCGTGLLVQLAASAGARVSGLDATEPLLAVARERVPQADLRVGDIEDLPYDDGTFDAVTAVNAVQYADQPHAAVREMARVTRRGGRVVIGVWGDPARCETEAVFAAVRTVAPVPPGTPGPLAVSAVGVVEELLAAAGLDGSTAVEVDCPFSYPDLATAWRGNRAGGPLSRAVEVAGEDAVRRAFEAAHAPHRRPDGSYRQENVFRYVVAGKRV